MTYQLTKTGILGLVMPALVALTLTASAQRGVEDSRQNALTKAIERVSPAVVGINVTEVREYQEQDPFWRFFYGDRVYQEKVQSLGSGWIMSADGYIITNHHVAGNAKEIIITMSNGEKHDARLVGSDKTTDVALLKMELDHKLPYVTAGNSDEVIVGEWSIAFGNPFGLFSASAKPTVTVGVISATHVYLEQKEGRVYRNMIQTDAAINSGNSGGPLVNSLGEVIGMNTVIYSPNQGSVGLGFAIPVNKVMQIVEILKNKGTVDRKFNPGFLVQAVNSAIARAYKLEKVEGVIVSDVDKRGSAAVAGLEVADVIVRANDEPIVSIDNLQSIVRYAIKGDVIDLVVLRAGKKLDIKLELQ
jgi:serine protease Do